MRRFEKWSELGIYKKIDIMSYLADRFTCILFDRRECGKSGGRLEILDFSGMARHGHAVLEQLGHRSAHVIGGCLRMRSGIGVRVYVSKSYDEPKPRLAGGWGEVSDPQLWPIFDPPGLGLRARDRRSYPESTRQRRRVRKRLDARTVGWLLRVDAGLVDSLRTSDETAYARLVQASYRVMFDCDSAPGPKPEELMQITRPACIVPGADESHARSAAHFVTECLPDSRFLDLPTDAQDSESVFTFFDGFYGA